MFDTLTLAELYNLHRDLHQQHNEIHAKLIGPDHQPLIDPMSSQWDVLVAKECEIGETMGAVYRAAARREQEAAGTRALRDLRNQRGIDA